MMMSLGGERGGGRFKDGLEDCIRVVCERNWGGWELGSEFGVELGCAAKTWINWP
jgi:hypothetical protein